MGADTMTPRRDRELEEEADRQAADLPERLDAIADRLERLVCRLEQEHPPPPTDHDRPQGAPDDR